VSLPTPPKRPTGGLQACVKLFTHPTNPGEQPDYASRQVFQAADTIPVVLDGKTVGQIAVNDLLP